MKTTAIASALLCTLAGGLPLAADAQQNRTQTGSAPATAEQRDYRIPAGDLTAALQQFGQQAGILLTYSTEQTRGQQSPGVQGRYTVDQALSRLLVQSNLQASATSGGYTLRPVARLSDAEADGTLPQVVVTASPDSSGTTEGTGSYTQEAPTTAATGLRLTQKQTPQSVSVVTRQQIEDFNLSTLQDIAKVTPGIYFKNGGVSSQEASAYARGFAISHLNVDGQAMRMGDFNGRSLGVDLAMYDSVEVVRGATGLMQGVGQPSGTINLVRKRPTAQPQFNLTGSLGSWSDKRLVVDASRPLTESGNVRARLIASGQDTNTFVDVTEDRNGLLYGIVEADLAAATQLSVGASVQRTRTDGLFRGLPSYSDGSHIGLPRSTYLDLPDSYQDRDTDIAFAELEHHLVNGWSLKGSYNFTDGSSDARYSHNTRIDGSETTLNSGEAGWRYDTRQHVLDVRASGTVEAFGRSHDLVFGANFREDDVSWNQVWSGSGDGRIVDIYNWNPYAHSLTGSVPQSGLQQQREAKEQGLYAAGNFQLAEPLHLIVGGRLSWYDEKYTGWYSGSAAMVPFVDEKAKFVPYAGVVFDWDDRHSVYASVADIFTPQFASDVNGNPLKPMTGTNYELGVKGEYFDGGLNASAAVFRIKQRDRAIRDEANCPTSGVAYCARAAGEVQSDGVELQLAGALTPAWQLSAGYTYVEAKYTRDAVQSNVGQRIATDEPQHIFMLATSYRLPGNLNRWTVRGALNGQSRIYSAETGYHTEQGSYVLADLGLGYRVSDQLHVQLQIDNVLDKTYYTGLGASWSGNGARYGKPRSFLLTAKYSL